MIKDGKIKTKGYKPDLKGRVSHLQEIAIILNKSISEDKKDEPDNDTEIKEQAPHTKPNNSDPITARKCCNCRIF